MRPQVDLQRAMREATTAYRTYPMRFGLLFAVWELFWQVANLGLHRSLNGQLTWLTSLTLPIHLLVNSVITVLIADLYLTARAGQTPRWNQLSRVLGYRGLFSYCLHLVFCFCLVGVAVLILFAICDLGLASATGLHHVSGTTHTATPADVVEGTAVAIAVVAMNLAMCRYSLAMTVFAVARGDRYRLFHFAVERALSVWGLLARIELIEAAPAVLVALFVPVVRLYWNPAENVSDGIDTVWTVALQFYYVWFVLLRVGLTTQLVQASEPVAA